MSCSRVCYYNANGELMCQGPKSNCISDLKFYHERKRHTHPCPHSHHHSHCSYDNYHNYHCPYRNGCGHTNLNWLNKYHYGNPNYLGRHDNIYSTENTYR